MEEKHAALRPYNSDARAILRVIFSGDPSPATAHAGLKFKMSVHHADISLQQYRRARKAREHGIVSTSSRLRTERERHITNLPVRSFYI